MPLINIPHSMLPSRTRSKLTSHSQNSMVNTDVFAIKEIESLTFFQERKYWNSMYTAIRKQLARLKSLLGRKTELRNELAYVTKERDDLDQRYQSLVREMGDMGQHLEGWRVAHRELAEKYDASRQETAVTKQDLARLSGQYNEKETIFTDEVERIRKEYGGRETAMKAQIAEFHTAQAYLSTVDSVSHAELERMVEKLNAQIYQLAALLADVIEVRQTGVSSLDDVTKSLESLKTGQWLGDAMLDRLSHLQSDGQFWVQVGLQAVMTEFATWRINTWDFDAPRDEGLKAIYEVLFREGKIHFAKCSALTLDARAPGYLRTVESPLQEIRCESRQSRWWPLPSRHYPYQTFDKRAMGIPGADI